MCLDGLCAMTVAYTETVLATAYGLLLLPDSDGAPLLSACTVAEKLGTGTQAEGGIRKQNISCSPPVPVPARFLVP